MNETVRIILRLLGTVLFAVGLLGVAYIVVVGPDEVGQQMGKECLQRTSSRRRQLVHLAGRPQHHAGVPVGHARRRRPDDPHAPRAGGDGHAVQRPPDRRHARRDRDRRRQPRRRLRLPQRLQRHPHDREAWPRRSTRRRQPVKPADASAPRGLAKGSLLEEDAFTKRDGRDPPRSARRCKPLEPLRLGRARRGGRPQRRQGQPRSAGRGTARPPSSRPRRRGRSTRSSSRSPSSTLPRPSASRWRRRTSPTSCSSTPSASSGTWSWPTARPSSRPAPTAAGSRASRAGRRACGSRRGGPRASRPAAYRTAGREALVAFLRALGKHVL